MRVAGRVPPSGHAAAQQGHSWTRPAATTSWAAPWRELVEAAQRRQPAPIVACGWTARSVRSSTERPPSAPSGLGAAACQPPGALDRHHDADRQGDVPRHDRVGRAGEADAVRAHAGPAFSSHPAGCRRRSRPGLTPNASGGRLGSMRAIITTFDAQAVTLTLAAAGPVEEAERDRLHELFRSSAVVEVTSGRRSREAPPASRLRPRSGRRVAEPGGTTGCTAHGNGDILGGDIVVRRAGWLARMLRQSCPTPSGFSRSP